MFTFLKENKASLSRWMIWFRTIDRYLLFHRSLKTIVQHSDDCHLQHPIQDWNDLGRLPLSNLSHVCGLSIFFKARPGQSAPARSWWAAENWCRYPADFSSENVFRNWSKVLAILIPTYVALKAHGVSTWFGMKHVASCNLSNNVWVERAENTWRNGSERLEEKLAMQIYHMVNQAVHVKAIFKSF